jgi:oligopeptide transport system substrate-binding protein
MLAFLGPIFVTGDGANDVDYSDDMPVVPLWDYITASGRSKAVKDVTIAWNGLPAYEQTVES